MEKTIRKILKQRGVSTEQSKLIVSIVLLNKSEIEKISEEKTKLLKEKSKKVLEKLWEKIEVEKKILSIKVDKETENIIEREINSHLKYLKIEPKMEEVEEIFEEEAEKTVQENHNHYQNNYQREV